MDSLKPIDRAENAIIRFLESRNEIPAGTYSQGHISYLPSNYEYATWTAGGGVIKSADEHLAAAILDLITAYKDRDNSGLMPLLQAEVSKNHSEVKSDFYAVLYRVPQGSQKLDLPCELVELRKDDIVNDGTAPESQCDLALCLKVRDITLSHASIIRMFDADNSCYYSVSVKTHPDHRRKGLGRAVVSAMLDRIADMRGVAIWECRVDNTASLKMARSLGFRDCIWTFNWCIQHS